MTQDEVQAELDDLPSSAKLIEMLDGDLPADALAGIAEMELEPSDTFAALWAECLDHGLSPEDLFRQKGLIQ